MKQILTKILPGILLVTLATSGFAENLPGAATISPFVGGYLLDTDQQEEDRPEFGLRAGYNFTKNFGAEAMFGYSLTETKQKYGSPREADRYRYGFEFLYHFMPDNKFVPFIAVGGGGTNFHIPNSPGVKNHYAGLVDYGVGVKYFVADNVALRGDVRHAILFHDLGDNNLEYSAGLTFQFGGVKKVVVAKPDTSYPSDNRAPTVTFTSPAKGATDVHVNQKVNVAFSEEMDRTTFTGATVTLNQGKMPVSGKLTSTASTVTFTPASDLEKGKVYTAAITTGARDLAGNALASNYQWGFTTGMVADVTAPTVTFTSPDKGAPAAPVSQKVSAAFSEPMDPETISAATFTLKEGITTVAGTVTSTGSNAIFTPARNFYKGKTYTATVTTGARDLAGNPLTRDYVWNFTTFALPKVLGCLATLDNSHFDFDSVKISENGKTILNSNITVLKNDPKMMIRIAGYASAAGIKEYNQKLSVRRAEVVREYLVNGGINANRLSIIGYGEMNPAQYEADPSAKLSPAALANMRVVLEVIE